MLYLLVECGGVEPLRGCPSLFAFAYSNFPATASVPLLRSFPPSSEATLLSDYPVRTIDYPVRLTIQCSWASRYALYSLISGLTLHP